MTLTKRKKAGTVTTLNEIMHNLTSAFISDVQPSILLLSKATYLVFKLSKL